MSKKQKDLTRAAAIALAKAKWGEVAYVAYGAVGGYRVGFLKVAGPYGRPFAYRQVVGQSPKGWREACERAGLLPAPAASTPREDAGR